MPIKQIIALSVVAAFVTIPMVLLLIPQFRPGAFGRPDRIEWLAAVGVFAIAMACTRLAAWGWVTLTGRQITS